jgi:hypothetical protein
MEQEYTVQFEARFKVKVKCKPEDLSDRISDLNIPEDDETQYVEDTFELFDVEDAEGNDVDEDGKLA